MRSISRIDRLILTAIGAAAAALLIAWQSAPEFPGFWPVVSFCLVAFLLDQTSTPLRISASGSTSFVMHMAAGILFGGFYGGAIAGISAGFSQLYQRVEPRKILFNVSQRALSVTIAVLVYRALGGSIPPTYLGLGETLSSDVVQRDLALFFLFATLYFSVNSIAVSGVIAVSSERSFREVWSLNTRGVLGYDLGASAIAMFVAWLFTKSQQTLGFGPIGLFGVIGPIIVVRHVYGLYHQLQENGQELLQLMVKAIEARDPYTSGHSLRVSQLSRAIAAELGLSATEIEQVETAALLHDVGKIHEEFAPLLRKEGKLTAEEIALMQTHSAKSAELVGIISKFRGFIHESVRHHHERWDGYGYPNGLSANGIPLGARIILVCDTIDAMTTDRPYRKRLGLDVVISELQKCKGTQFDPDLVDVVVSSVAVRRLVVDPPSSTSFVDRQLNLERPKRVSWPSSALWKTRRA
ncbi:MAG: HD-GYP domain-containing protein [Gemmatimonadales bacterium]